MKDNELEIWKIAINTQMHFNDLIMKIRAIVTSLITAIFGASALSLRDIELVVPLFNREVHISVFIISAGLIFLIAYWILDFCYYFPLLLGAVECSEKIENEIGHKYLNLTQMISKKVSVKRAYLSLSLFYGIIILLGVIGISYMFSLSPNLK